jgi:hypothetical protein
LRQAELPKSIGVAGQPTPGPSRAIFGEGRLLVQSGRLTFVLDCLLGVNKTELQFGVGTRIALQTKTNWRAAADEDGH